MICNEWRQELDSWQNAKSQSNPARGKCPLAKVKGIYFNKSFSFAGTNKVSTKLLPTNHYAATGRALQKAKIMASTFGYFRRKQIPIILSFCQTTIEQLVTPCLYKASKIKEEGRANLLLLFVILSSFLTLLLSQSCNSISGNLPFQVFDKIRCCK